ncbi:hypothetical protein A5906_26230 [Bradyrhizobium sacchari]|uniref:Putative DNA-binding protein n=1 Tax=Bradyrhizobium sacchari TaxID=1399419 RepID=A0A560JZE6_9BRAD|nr:ATP-binding protein [Bradyrhizobium sacchari]OPY99230.1 hypothetical protein A5906_26230 [Bradyrhizobium sacchari]TWB62961.1 putative DNA-binding protein [Bradyrhizobium sacchari]TWB76109.1 putative DNA-binding protein [Bradyrhizobium sacchari]
MALISYKTLDDVRAIVANQIPEGLNLEYKSSSILINRDANALCKTVSAFANSAGGTFIIGIEMDKLAPVRLDDGTPGPSKRDWIFQVINGGTFPAIEAIEVREFATPTGMIFVIDVPPSAQAPHQSKDNKYYKRRDSLSEVMEHYEIEDIRNRPKRALAPLRAELHTQNILSYLRLTNTHETDAISDLRCEIDANFDLGRDSLSMLTERGLRALLPKHELHFLLGSVVDFLQTPEPAITFRFRFHDGPLTSAVTFHMADLNRTAIMTSPLERALEKLGEKIDKASGHLEHLRRSAETMTNMIDGTGLRLSQRTLNTLRNMPQLFDPREFDADGYRIIADIPIDDAHQLSRLLHYFPDEQAKEEYGKIAPDVRERFEKYFKVSFDE